MLALYMLCPWGWFDSSTFVAGVVRLVDNMGIQGLVENLGWAGNLADKD